MLTTTMLSATNGGHLSVPTLSPVLTASSFGLPLPYPFHSHQLFRVAVRCPPPPLLPVPVLCSWVVSLQKGGGGEGGAKGEGLARLLESLAVLTQGRRCGWASESADFPLLSTRGHKGQPWRARETRSHPRLCAHTHNCTKTCTPLHTDTQRHTDTFPTGSRAQPCTHSHWHALTCTRSRGPAAVGSPAFTLWARTRRAAHRATHARSYPHTPRPWRRSGRCAAPATGGDPGGGGGGGDSGGGGAG